MATHAETKSLNLPDAGTIARTAVLGLAIINQILTATGHSVLPFSDEAVTNTITTVFTGAAALAAWWKNNNFTKAAREGSQVTKALKAVPAAEATDIAANVSEGAEQEGDDLTDAGLDPELDESPDRIETQEESAEEISVEGGEA
ncbi:MAG: phage holin [Bifidobacteriaceae bacterium]|jgi:SPP1 family holin|nr:phage holin [Bifidobacteriaceae bacterium]